MEDFNMEVGAAFNLNGSRVYIDMVDYETGNVFFNVYERTGSSVEKTTMSMPIAEFRTQAKYEKNSSEILMLSEVENYSVEAIEDDEIQDAISEIQAHDAAVDWTEKGGKFVEISHYETMEPYHLGIQDYHVTVLESESRFRLEQQEFPEKVYMVTEGYIFNTLWRYFEKENLQKFFIRVQNGRVYAI